MNPGFQAFVFTVVFMILVLFGWGTRTLQDGKLTPKRVFTVLLVYLLGTGVTFRALGLTFDIGGIAMPLLMLVWTLRVYDTWALRLQWVMGTLTVASVMVVLMTLVPLDPAFFPMDGKYLYPAAAVLVSIISVRRPFAALTVGVAGMALGAFVDPFIHDRIDVHSVVFGGEEMRDLMVFTACGVLLFHGLYHAAARYVIAMFKQIFDRREGGPEHV